MTCIFGNNARYIAVLSAFLVVICAASFVEAGPLASAPEALSPGGPDFGFWRGSSVLSNNNGFASISGTASFAVFGPGGSFQTFLDNSYPGDGYTDPSAGTEYVYAFQVQSDSNSSIETLNAGFDFGANTGSFSTPQSLVSSGDVGPGTMAFNSTSAQWGFGGGVIANTQVSDVLFYTSDFGPQPDGLTIGAEFGMVQANSSLSDFASPSPEPTSAIILIIGTVLWLLAGRRGGHF